MRILFSSANELDLNIDHVDVTTAFLNGELYETLYMEQPPGFPDNNNNKLFTSKRNLWPYLIYLQANRIWDEKVHTLLSEKGYKQLNLCQVNLCERCVYSKNMGKNLFIAALYVDDC